eukprot:UN15722
MRIEYDSHRKFIQSTKYRPKGGPNPGQQQTHKTQTYDPYEFMRRRGRTTNYGPGGPGTGPGWNPNESRTHHQDSYSWDQRMNQQERMTEQDKERQKFY